MAWWPRLQPPTVERRHWNQACDWLNRHSKTVFPKCKASFAICAPKTKMDKILTREEIKQLMDLIDLPEDEWGNEPLISHRMKLAIKKHHPDKGGDEEKMKLLNRLKSKFEDGMKNLSPDEFEDENVCYPFRPDCSVGEYLGDMWGKRVLKEFTTCVGFEGTFCKCLTCIIRRGHKSRVKTEKIPLTWGQCWCFKCYCIWFGCPSGRKEHFQWSIILFNMSMRTAGLWGKIKL